MIIVGSNMGVSKMTKEHLGISLFLKIPFLIILTKIDIAPKNIYDETLLVLQKILKSKLV
jgi:GTPase